MFSALITRIPDRELAAAVKYFDYPEMPAAHGPAAIPVKFTPGSRVGSKARLVV